MSVPVFMFTVLMVIGLPVSAILYMAHRYFRLRERKLEVEAGVAAEKAAQYATSNAQLEQRVRVLEQIVTDAGAETAAQIEALREQRSLKAPVAAGK